MYDTEVLALLRKHFKEETEFVVTTVTPPNAYRYDASIPGQRYPAGYHASRAMQDAWFEQAMLVAHEKIGKQLLPSWVHRRRKPVQK